MRVCDLDNDEFVYILMCTNNIRQNRFIVLTDDSDFDLIGTTYNPDDALVFHDWNVAVAVGMWLNRLVSDSSVCVCAYFPRQSVVIANIKY